MQYIFCVFLSFIKGEKCTVSTLHEKGCSTSDALLVYLCFVTSNRTTCHQTRLQHDTTTFIFFSSGSYEIAEADGVTRGTKIIIRLKDSDKRFSLKATVEGIMLLCLVLCRNYINCNTLNKRSETVTVLIFSDSHGGSLFEGGV